MPEAGFEPARLSTTVFETAASAVPPLRRRNELYLTSAKTPILILNLSFLAGKKIPRHNKKLLHKYPYRDVIRLNFDKLNRFTCELNPKLEAFIWLPIRDEFETGLSAQKRH